MKKILLAIVLMAACGGGRAPGRSCKNDSECDDGLECLMQYQVSSCNSLDGCTCGIAGGNYKICSRPCSSDDQCSDLGKHCSAASSCGGSHDLCGWD